MLRGVRRDGVAVVWILVGAAFALYVVALFHPLIAHVWRGGPAAWIEGDVPEEYFPDLAFLCRGLSHAHVPLWNPYEHGGAPFYADPQAGAFYPVNWAMCALAGPSPSFHWGDARVVFHFWLACMFMTAFLRGERLDWPASIVGGALFPLTPFFRHNWELNLTWTFAYVPLLLLLVRVVTRKPSLTSGALLGAAGAFAVLSGSPPSLFYAGLIVVPFAVYATVTAAAPRKSISMMAFGIASMLAISMPMLAAARELASLSVRSHLDFAATADGGLGASQLLGVLLPDMNEHTYMGLVVLAMIPWAFVGSPYRPARLFAAIALVGLILMLGDHTPLFHAMYALVPGAAQFRDPTRYSALWGTSIVVLAAVGLDAMAKRVIDKPRWNWVRICGAIAVATLLIAIVPKIDPLTHGKGLGLAGMTLALGVVADIFARDPRVLTAAIGVLACIDLFSWLPPARHTRAGPLPEHRTTYEALRSIAGDELEAYRTYDEFGIHMRSGSRLGLREFRGYQDPLSLGRYQKVVGELETAPLVLAMFNVRWVLWGPHYIYGDGHHLLADPANHDWATLRAPANHIYEIPAALPMAYWMDTTEIAQDADDALLRVRSSAPSPVIVLESGSALAGAGAFRAEKVTRGSETITVDVVAPAAGFVVVNEASYPGWEAQLDGERVAITRANSLVMAIAVPSGTHQIALAFRPWQARVLSPIAALVALGLLAIFARALLLKRRELD